MKPCQKTHCRKSVLIIALFLSMTGIAMAESTHEKSQCGHSPACILTVLKSFVQAVQDGSKGVNFSVGP